MSRNDKSRKPELELAVINLVAAVLGLILEIIKIIRKG